jgi:hypothetical protein
MFKTIKKMKTSKRLAIVDKKGEIIGGETHFEENYQGDDIERSNYKWGGRYNEGEGDIKGLVRMVGGGGYFTFRVISAASPRGSWIKREVLPVDVLSALERTTRPKVEEIIDAGLQADLAND